MKLQLPFVLIICLLACSQAEGQTSDLTIDSFPTQSAVGDGIERLAMMPIWSIDHVTLIVDAKPEDLAAVGTSETEIIEEAKQTLIDAGIKIVDTSYIGRVPERFAFVSLTVTASRNGSSTSVYVKLDVNRYARLAPDLKTLTSPIVWSQGVLGVFSTKAGVQSSKAANNLATILVRDIETSKRNYQEFQGAQNRGRGGK